MTTCIIVLGWDTGTRLGASAFDCLGSYGGSEVARCTPCGATSRITFPQGASGNHTVNALTYAELKPAETYVLTFESDGATRWLESHASVLVGKTVYMINPAIS